MKDKVIKQLYDFWSKTDNDNAKLLEEITNNVNNGLDGAKVLLDWCRNEYDTIKEQYKKLHNLTDTEMGKVMEENHGSYEFMYNEIPYAIDLEDIWNLCNYYLDYCNKDITEHELLKLIKEEENNVYFCNNRKNN